MVDKKTEKVKCWEVLNCNVKECPAFHSKDLKCWLFSGTHCHNSIQGKFLEKMEMCLGCKILRANMDVAAMRDTIKTVNKQFKEFRKIVDSRDRELEDTGLELALSISEVLEALKKISSGNTSIRLDETSTIELISLLKHVVNLTAKQVRESAETMRFIQFAIEHTSDAAFWMKSDARFIYVNEAACRLLGYSRDELLSMTVHDIDPMFPKEAWLDHWQKLTERKSFAFESQHKAKNGRIFPVEIRDNFVEFEGNEYNCAFVSDITERKQVEKILREAELRYRTVAEFTHDWEYWETPDRKLCYVSPSCERITGYKPEYFIDNPNLIYEITLPEDRDNWSGHHHDSAEMPVSQSITFRIRRKDETIRWIEHVCQPVIDQQKVFLGVRASNRDITIRKQAEEKLRDTLSLLTATLESTADGILVVDSNGKIVSFNRKFVQLWGILDSTMASGDDDKVLAFVLDQLKDPLTFLTRVRELYAQPEVESHDVLLFKDGRVFERYSQPQKIGNSIIGRVWSFSDVTERKRAEDALRESEQLLLQAHKMEAIGRLAAGVAHEINNPLAVINEKAGLMKDILELSTDLKQDKEKFLGVLQTIFENVKRCRIITHRLLGFSRRTEISQDVINLNDTVREIMEFLEKEIWFRNIHLRMNLNEDIPKIVIDKGQLQQVLLNIVNNAIDAVEKEGIIEVLTDFNANDKNTVHVSVKDNGIGIPQDILQHIFEPFFTTKEKGKGTGLGLSISYGIMQKLGGTILAQSEVNKGTTFTIEIPLKAATV